MPQDNETLTVNGKPLPKLAVRARGNERAVALGAEGGDDAACILSCPYDRDLQGQIARFLEHGPEIARQAQALLDKLACMTTEQFSLGGEKAEREALRNALQALTAVGEHRAREATLQRLRRAVTGSFDDYEERGDDDPFFSLVRIALEEASEGEETPEQIRDGFLHAMRLYESEARQAIVAALEADLTGVEDA
jgi:hypothetical protein